MSKTTNQITSASLDNIYRNVTIKCTRCGWLDESVTTSSHWKVGMKYGRESPCDCWSNDFKIVKIEVVN